MLEKLYIYIYVIQFQSLMFNECGMFIIVNYLSSMNFCFCYLYSSIDMIDIYTMYIYLYLLVIVYYIMCINIINVNVLIYYRY